MPALIKNLVLPIAALALAALIALAMVNSRAELPKRDREENLPLVKTVQVETGPVAVTIQSRGVVTPRWNTELVSEVSGRVIWVSPDVRTGAEVKAGQDLLRIDPIDYEVAVTDARAALASAQLGLAEVSVVRKEAAIEEAKAQVEAAKARLKQAEVNLANTHIAAPFDAVVDSKHADLGQYVQAGSPVLSLLGIETAEVRLPVLAADVPYLRYGRNAGDQWEQATLTAELGDASQSWPARLARLERRVDPQTRTFFVVAEVDNPYDLARYGRALVMGLFVEAQFTGNDIPDAVRLPRSVLHKDNKVYVVRDGRLYLQPVELLRREKDSVILRGLESGQRVVTSRLDLVVDGMAVNEAGRG
ncbi:efflux RND transporter periplasmic adaptor subunit [Haliea sp. E17]|uniref:efflux RND transporter periplasmic adaptor subunit n=1 Tax=Haliea sp. E17 TaxID=3401576 RepID=UPI003AAA768F